MRAWSCKKILPLAVLLLGTTVVGLQASAHQLTPLTPAEVYTRAQELTNVPWHGQAVELDQGTFGSCLSRAVTVKVGDPINHSSQDMHLMVIRPDSQKPVPVVIIVPTLDGVTIIEKEIARKLCDLHIASIIADVNDTSIPSEMPAWGHEDRTDRHSILSLRTVIDFATQNKNFDPAKVGLMGSSLGAIQSAFLAGLEANRLAAIALVLAGGNIPFIMSASNQSTIARFRELRMENQHMTSVDQYEAMLEKTMRYDPLYFTSFANPKNIFMVLSSNDDKVPSAMQQQLFKALGSPASTTFSVGHVETITSLTFIYFGYIADFFTAKFALGHDVE